jgi:undecaprenyl-diphosphatase
MDAVRGLRGGERRLTKRIASWDNARARRVLPAVADMAEHSKLWCGAAALMAAGGGGRGARAAAAGLAGVVVAQVASNVVAKHLYGRRRPPKEWIPHHDVDDRPDSSSFPSGHMAAAAAFTAAVAPAWPWAGAACAMAAVLVGVERVHDGAHSPSDVVAGAGIGLANAWLVRASPRLLLRCRR